MTTLTRRGRQELHELVDQGLAIVNEDTGDAPCCRWGTKSQDFSPWIVALAWVYSEANGDDPTDRDLLDSCASMIVNDSDGAAELLAEYLGRVPVTVRRRLGVTVTEAKQLAR